METAFLKWLGHGITFNYIVFSPYDICIIGEVDIRGFLLFSNKPNAPQISSVLNQPPSPWPSFIVPPQYPALETHLFRFVLVAIYCTDSFPNMLFWGTNLQPCNGMTMQHEFVLSQNLLLSATHATLFFIN